MGIVIFWIVCGGLSAVVASDKGRSTIGWFLGGLLFGPLGLIAVACMSKVEPSPSDHYDTGVMACPHCAETIKSAAVVCRYCGRDVTPVIAPTIVESGAF